MHRIFSTSLAVAVLSAVPAISIAQDLDDIRAAQGRQLDDMTQTNDTPSAMDPILEDGVEGDEANPAAFDVDLSLFTTEPVGPTHDELAATFKLLHFMEHAVTNAPRTIMSIDQRLLISTDVLKLGRGGDQ